MPPNAVSRHLHTTAYEQADGRWFLSDRAPYRYRDLPDTRVHTAAGTDTLFSLAGRYFAPLPRACGLWWAIADFQPVPIVDPTLALDAGTQVHIPSVRVVTTVILGEARRREH